MSSARIRGRPASAVMSIFVVLVLHVSACGGPVDDRQEDPSPALGAAEDPIYAEIPGRAESAWKWYRSPEIAKAAYATPSLEGCTATMIGPNLMMSAAHCGNSDRRINFLTFRRPDPAVYEVEYFNCRILINGFPNTDLTLYFCDPNAAGQNPGDKYGYLDTDPRPVTSGTSLFSMTRHPISSLSIWDGQLYVSGSVTATDAVIWGGEAAPMGAAVGIHLDMWGEAGSSGSSHVNPAGTHREGQVRVGPVSTANGTSRNALSMATLYSEGNVRTDRPEYIHDQTLTSLGLANPQSYIGRLDKNDNAIFDVQEDIERLRRENPRDWFDLSFHSRRRTVTVWDSSRATFDSDAGTMSVNFQLPYVAWWRLATARSLPLKANTLYRVSFMVSTGSASASDWLRIDFQQNGQMVMPVVVNPTPGAGWQMFTTMLRTWAGGPTDLNFFMDASVSASLSAVSLVEEGSAMDFDLADKRFFWRNDNNGLRGVVLPRGRRSDTAPNWAGLAVATPALGANDWPLRNRQLALIKDRNYQICAWHSQTEEAIAASRHPNGRMRLISGGSEVGSTSFAPESAWAQACFVTGNLPSSDANLQFGFPGSQSGDEYLVDDISIETVGGSVPFSATATDSAQVGTRDEYVYLRAGQTVTVGTCGMAGSSASGDTFLRLLTATGALAAYDDDNCGGLGSNISYTVPAGAGGLYTIRAGCYRQDACGGVVAFSIDTAGGSVAYLAR